MSVRLKLRIYPAVSTGAIGKTAKERDALNDLYRKFVYNQIPWRIATNLIRELRHD